MVSLTVTAKYLKVGDFIVKGCLLLRNTYYILNVIKTLIIYSLALHIAISTMNISVHTLKKNFIYL